MATGFSRREFLKLSGLALGGLALQPRAFGHSLKPPDAIGLVRVAADAGIQIYDQPQYPRYNDQVKVVATRKRDQLLYVYEKFEADTGPEFNPRWYRLDEGYAHTAYLQPVETNLNEAVPYVSDKGELFEVTVPLTQSYRLTRTLGWEKLYRLYYLSTHWVTGIETGPDGAQWYRILDELLQIEYYVLAAHLRKIPASELTPVSTRVRLEDKRVEVSIYDQRLLAYEEDAVVLDTKVSTGIPNLQSTNGIPSYTPKGNWIVFSKMPVRHMGEGRVTSDINAYELPGVPWVSYFHEWGVAFHGTYWHDNFGNEMSHGCVNMRPDEAKWLFRWLLPVAAPNAVHTPGNGTRVVVF
ncbi:MAG TPA: L,D-transpeptidase [Anaerolineales bacterium]|nr:L,D-transpeptidase [Anaerolineales bacterium]HLE73101.1 L,D-transpeptidase [Anaerolineales bacterium]